MDKLYTLIAIQDFKCLLDLFYCVLFNILDAGCCVSVLCNTIIWVYSNLNQTEGDKELNCIWSQSSDWPRVKLETVSSFLPDMEELFDKELDFLW